MNKLKKVFPLIVLIVGLVFGLIVVRQNQETRRGATLPQVDFYFSPTTLAQPSLNVGSTFNVSILGNANQRSIGLLSMRIKYDKTKLRLIDTSKITTHTQLRGGNFTEVNNNEGYAEIIVIATGDELASTVTNTSNPIIGLNFDVLAKGDARVYIDKEWSDTAVGNGTQNYDIVATSGQKIDITYNIGGGGGTTPAATVTSGPTATPTNTSAPGQPTNTPAPPVGSQFSCGDVGYDIKVWAGATPTAECQTGGVIKISSGGFSDSEVYRQFLNVDPNSTYRLSYQVRTENLVTGTTTPAAIYGAIIPARYIAGVTDFGEYLTGRIKTGFEEGVGIGVSGTTNGWIPGEYTFTTENNVGLVRLRLAMGLRGQAKGSVWYRDISLVKVSGGSTPPVPTPTSGATGSKTVSFEVSMSGVRDYSRCLGSNTVDVIMLKGNTRKEYKNVALVDTGKNTTKNEKIFLVDRLNITDFGETSGVAIFVKGQKHLQMKYGVDNQNSVYNKAGGELTFTNSTVFDFTGYPMLAGDVNRDGKVDGVDFVEVKKRATNFDEVTSGQSSVYDLDGSCVVNNVDVGLLTQALKDKHDQMY